MIYKNSYRETTKQNFNREKQQIKKPIDTSNQIENQKKKK